MAIHVPSIMHDTDLHLLTWDRLDQRLNSEGLRFVGQCMQDPDLRDHTMPLIRPMGRKQQVYCDFNRRFQSAVGRLPRGITPGTQCVQTAEAWFQVSQSRSDLLWDTIAIWVSGHSDCAAWKSDTCNPTWQPLSNSHADCEYYCEDSPAWSPPEPSPRIADASSVLTPLAQDTKAQLLKLIWYRASEVIATHPCPILDIYTPAGAQEALAVLGRILRPFAAEDYGIEGIRGEIDPTAFAVSHMAAFAINALTKAQPTIGYEIRYTLESRLGRWRAATRPHLFGRGRYLSILGSALLGT